MENWIPFAFYINYFWNATGTSAKSWFIVSDAHTPCCILLHDIFYVFEGDLNWQKRDWPQHFQVKLFQLKNELLSAQYFSRRLLNQLFHLKPYLSSFFGINVVKGQRDVRTAMSNPNGLLSQKSCCYLTQGRTFNDILMRVAHWMTYVWVN